MWKALLYCESVMKKLYVVKINYGNIRGWVIKMVTKIILKDFWNGKLK